MEKVKFTPEALMERLIIRYQHLNDNGQKAKEMYDKIIAGTKNSK